MGGIRLDTPSEAEVVATMPVLAPETVVVTPIGNPATISTPKPAKEASRALSDYIKPSLIRYPMYDYQTGSQWFLSKTEQIVVDAYLETNNVTESCRALNAIRGAHGSTKFYTPNAVARWLKKPHVARYIANKFLDKGKVNWFDSAKWESWGVDVMQGAIAATQVQVVIWKEYGKAKGWYKDTGPQVQHNTQINFVQSDGKA